MSDHLTTDARHHIYSGRPLDVDVLPVDEQVVVAIGAQRALGEVVWLVMSEPSACSALASQLI